GDRLGADRAAAVLDQAAQGTADAFQRLGQLGRDDPYLVGLAGGDLRQGLQVLVGKDFGVRVGCMYRVEDRLDRLGLAFGLQDAGLPFALGPQDRGLPFTVGGQDLRLLDALGVEDRGATVPLGAHLLLHRVADRRRRLDRLDLDPGDLDAPPA